MKKKILFIVSILVTMNLYSQEAWNIYSSCGQYASSTVVNLHYSIGQSISTNTANVEQYTQGFHFNHNALHVGVHNHNLFPNMKVYPNPAINYTMVEFGNHFHGELKLISNEGRILYRQLINSSKVTIDLSQYVNGLYILEGQSQKSNFKATILLHK
jgi:hypothetical protein